MLPVKATAEKQTNKQTYKQTRKQTKLTRKSVVHYLDNEY